MINKKTISIFVPHVGCPNDCVFCNQRRITGQSNTVESNDVKNIINEQLLTMKDTDIVELAFFGGSFTAIEIEVQKELLQAVNPFIKSGDINYIRVSTRPDAIDEERLTLLKSNGVKIIELGVQSLDDNVLLYSNRGHDAECVYKASKLIKAFGFELGLQMMLGLPKDSKKTIIDTAWSFVKIKPQYVRIYPVLVIKDTELENQLNLGKYKLISIEDTMDIVSELIIIFETNNIKIIRIGLQNSESISLEGSVIAGPFHPSLGELCYSRLYRRVLDFKFKTCDITTGKVTLYVWEKDISKFIGNSKSNIIYFQEKNINIKVVGQKLNQYKMEHNSLEYIIDLEKVKNCLSNCKEG